MKVVCPRQEFLSELQIVARAAATRGAIQALSGVLLKAEGNELELAATDTEIALRTSLEAQVEKPGTVLLPARLLVEIVRSTGGEGISLEHRAEASEVSVSSERAIFALRTLLADDFPRIPDSPGNGDVVLPAIALAQTIERVAKAASRDETRPVLTGILVSVEDGTLRMVATDSYRLSVKETPLETGADVRFEANVPARALQELSRVVSEKSAEAISIVSRENQVVFGAERVTLSSRLIDGQFPNYRQLLPESYEHEVKVSREELLAVVRRVSLMAQRTAPLRVRFEQGMVTLSAQTPDVGEASESLPVNYQGDELEIGFNPQFLQDGLESVESDELCLKLITALRPGLIEAAGSDTEDATTGSFLYLIMPVRLNV
jgi:DNA polymerase III subunit beta